MVRFGRWRPPGLRPRAEEREPVDGFVAEHETDVTIGDLPTPATHRGGGDLLLEQAIGDLDTVQPKAGDVQQQRPAARRAHHGQTAQLAERLVAAPLHFCVRRDYVIIGEAQGDSARADLGEPAWHQPVVDLDTRDIIDELAPARPPPPARRSCVLSTTARPR